MTLVVQFILLLAAAIAAPRPALARDGAACEPAWSDQFHAGDLDGPAYCSAVFDDGSGHGECLYVGGTFAFAGGTRVNGIARWDGKAWSALGEGLFLNDSPFSPSGYCFALTVHDDGAGPALYVGGLFKSAGGVATSNIARWDGSSWIALGLGVYGSQYTGFSDGVYALASFNDGSNRFASLIAAGGFAKAGSQTVHAIACWDGSEWHDLGGGISGSFAVIGALHVLNRASGSQLFAGGYFLAAGGVSANAIAAWDGRAWSALGDGIDGGVYSLTSFDDGSGDGAQLCAGGDFQSAGGVAANHIARWDGRAWSAMGGGFGTILQPVACVQTLAVADGSQSLFAGLDATAGAPGSPAAAKWNGRAWMSIDGIAGPNRIILGFSGYGSKRQLDPILLGSFLKAGDTMVQNIARLEDGKWAPLNPRDLLPFASTTFLIDEGRPSPTLLANGIALPDGSFFRGIAKRSAGAWIPLTDPLPSVSDFFVAFQANDGLRFYAAGHFIPGDTTTWNLAGWDGAAWTISTIPIGTSSSAVIKQLATYGDGNIGPALYIAGNFDAIDGQPAGSIAKWDGRSWSNLNGGVRWQANAGTVNALAVHDAGAGAGPVLYVGGLFSSAGGSAIAHMATWDGSTWRSAEYGVGPGAVNVYKPITAFAVIPGACGEAIFAAASRLSDSGGTEPAVITWNGVEWVPTGDFDVSPTVMSPLLGFGRSRLMAGGRFTIANGAEVNGIAMWDGETWSPLGSGIDGSWDPDVFVVAPFDDGQDPLVYIRGRFESAGGLPAPNFAMYSACFDGKPLPGDVDGNGCIGMDDLLAILNAWGPCDRGGSLCPADLDGDGTINEADLAILLAHWS